MKGDRMAGIMDEGGQPKKKGVPDRRATADAGVKPLGAVPGAEGAGDLAAPKADAPGATLSVATAEGTLGPVAIRSIWPSRLRVNGPVTGMAYEWSGAGAVVMVEPEDVPGLLELNHRRQRACCGGSGQRTLFQTLD
jgi:hypothetical protein